MNTEKTPHPLFTICYRGYCRVAQIGTDFKLNTGRYLNFSHHKIKLYTTPIISILVIFTFLFVAIFGVYSIAKESITRQFQRTFEKKTLEQLNTFHTRTVYMTTTYFEQSFNTMNNIISDYQSLQTNTFTHDRKIDTYLDSIAVYDKQGTMLFISSDNPDAQNSVGKNFSSRGYFQSAIEKPGLKISGIDVITLSGQTISVNGVLRVIIGFTYLDSLKRVIAPAQLFSFVLTDKDGNIILEESPSPKAKTNIKSADNVVSDLFAGSPEIIREEINYRGEPVLAQGNAIILPDKSKMYLVSYYPKSEFNKELNLVKSDIDRIYVLILGVLLTTLILSFVAMRYAINHNEKIINS